MTTLRDLLGQLSAEGALAADLPERAAAALAEAPRETTPWYIHLIVAFGSWVAAILLIVFMVLVQLIESAGAALVVGLILCAAAIMLRRLVDRVGWLAQLPLAICLAGEVMVVAGVSFGDLASGDDVINLALLTLVVLELALIVLYRDWLHRFLSAAVIAGALLGLLLNNDLRLGAAILVAGLGWAVALVWERESAWARHDALGRPVAYGLVVGFLGCLIALVFDETPLDWPASLGLAAALVYVAWTLLAQASLQARLLGAGGALLLLAPAWDTPGMLGAALVLVVGFSRGNRVLIGLGGLFLAGFISQYYYALDMTLLQKSFAMAAAGLLLLAARLLVGRAAARAQLS
jgi:hypothetical protein